MSHLLETLQPYIDTLTADADASINTFAQQITTVVTAYDSGSLTHIPERPSTDIQLLQAVFNKSLMDAQVAIEASSEPVAAATAEIHTAINAL